jgi:hypothetical protein
MLGIDKELILAIFLLIKQGILPRQWDGEMVEALKSGVQESAISKLSRKALDKSTKTLMFAFTKSEQFARLQTHFQAKRIAKYIMEDPRLAEKLKARISSATYRNLLQDAIDTKNLKLAEEHMDRYLQSTNLFNYDKLNEVFKEHFEDMNVIVYGEAYGGKQQGMSNTYGKELKFIVFDVKIDKNWLDVLNAESVANKLGLDFVNYERITTDLDKLDFHRDKYSVQARLNGCGEDKIAEGIVIRPLIELTKNRIEHLNDQEALGIIKQKWITKY